MIYYTLDSVGYYIAKCILYSTVFLMSPENVIAFRKTVALVRDNLRRRTICESLLFDARNSSRSFVSL